MILRKFLICVFLLIYFCPAAAGQDKEHSNHKKIKIIWIDRFDSKQMESDSCVWEDLHDLLRTDLIFLCEQLCAEKELQIESAYSAERRHQIGESMAKRTPLEVRIKDFPAGSIDYVITTDYIRYENRYTITSTIVEPVFRENNELEELKTRRSCRIKINYTVNNKGEIKFTEEPITPLAEELAFHLKEIYDFRKAWFIYPKHVDITFESEFSEEYKKISENILAQLEFEKKGGVQKADSAAANAELEVILTKITDQVIITAIIKKKHDFEHLASDQQQFKEINDEESLDHIVFNKIDYTKALKHIITELSVRLPKP